MALRFPWKPLESSGSTDGEIGTQLFAVEVKASRSVAPVDLRGLQSFREYYGKSHRSWILYQGTARKKLRDVEVWPWQEGIRELFQCAGMGDRPVSGEHR
jgi:hypothetical protein